MKTIKDLGKLIKEKYPEYGDMPDEEVGRLMKDRFPDAYNDFEDTGLSVSSNQLQVNISNAIDRTAHEHVDFLRNKLKPNNGWFSSWLQTTRSQRNIRLLDVLAANEIAIIQHGAILERAARLQQQERLEYEIYIKEHESTLMALEARRFLFIKATEMGLSVEDYSEHRKAELAVDLEIRKYMATEGMEKLAAIHKEKELSNIRINEHREKAQIDFQNEVGMAQEELRLQIIADHLTHHQQITLIQDLIDDQYIKIDAVRTSKIIPEGAKPEIIESRMRIIEMFMRHQNETQTKILQS
ncbi:hypothetical protein BH10ACI1_BH10ACI1_02730 [soil metagenome]